MPFAQFTFRTSLRDVEMCLTAHRSEFHHSGFRGSLTRSTSADANERCDWRTYADTDLGLDTHATVYALDAITTNHCMSLFPVAPSRRTTGAVSVCTLIDLPGTIPIFLRIADGKVYYVNLLDLLAPEPRAYFVMDRGYLDFARLDELHRGSRFFIIRAKCNLQCRRWYYHPLDFRTGVHSDRPSC